MSFDPYYSWLGIPPSEQPPNHYRLLGLSLFEPNEEAIYNAADRQMAHVHSFQSGPHAADSQRLLSELAFARNCLLDLDQRRSYDTHLRLRLSRSLSAVAAVPVEIPGQEASTQIPLSVTNYAPSELRLGDVAAQSALLYPASPDTPAASGGIATSDFGSGDSVARLRQRKPMRAVSQLLQIVGGGATGIVLSLLAMHYLLGINVSQLFSLPERQPPVVVKKHTDQPSPSQPTPVTQLPQPQPVRPAADTKVQRTPATPKLAQPSISEPSKPPPLPKPDLPTMRGSLQAELRKSRLQMPSEADLLAVKATADAILAKARQHASAEPYAIAQLLIQQARGQEPALRYTLLMWAAEAAREAGKFQLMCDVIDDLAREQFVEALSTKSKLLSDGEPSIVTPESATSFVDVASLVIDEALLRFDHATAYDLNIAIMSIQGRIDEPSLRDKCDRIRRKVEQRTGIVPPAPVPPQPNTRRFTGLFHVNGNRGEAFVAPDGDVSDLTKTKLDTISGWSQQALRGKSEAIRYAAMDTLICIARTNSAGNSQLTESELDEFRVPVADLLRSKDKASRALAASIMGLLPAKPEDLKALLACLRDAEPQVRIAAAESLAKVADESCIDPLMRAIRMRTTQIPDDPHEMSRLIVLALGHIGTEKAAKALNSLLSEQKDRSVLQAIQDELNRIALEPK